MIKKSSFSKKKSFDPKIKCSSSCVNPEDLEVKAQGKGRHKTKQKRKKMLNL